MKENYTINYVNEEEFKKKEIIIKNYDMLAYNKLMFECYPSFKEGNFQGNLIATDNINKVNKYALTLPTDLNFANIYGNIILYYIVYIEQKIVVLESLVSDKIFSDEYKKENINQNNKTINNNLGQEYSQVLTWNLTSSKINNIDNINNQELQNNNIRHIENNTINKSVNNIYQNYSEGQQMSVNHNEVSSFKPKTVFNSPC